LVASTTELPAPPPFLAAWKGPAGLPHQLPSAVAVAFESRRMPLLPFSQMIPPRRSLALGVAEHALQPQVASTGKLRRRGAAYAACGIDPPLE
jgi:hypothetical protein